MQKKLTIRIEEDVYNGLYEVVGAGKISKFIETLVRPHVVDVDAALAELAADEEVEREARAWDAVGGDGLAEVAAQETPEMDEEAWGTEEERRRTHYTD